MFMTVFGIHYNFSFLYLFNCKFVDLSFSVLPDKICAPKKFSVSQRFCAPTSSISISIKHKICLGLPSRIRKWSLFSQFRRTSTKVITMEKT